MSTPQVPMRDDDPEEVYATLDSLLEWLLGRNHTRESARSVIRQEVTNWLDADAATDKEVTA